MTPQQIVAATLRQLAGWGVRDRTPDSLYELAAVVEQYDHATGDLEALCCPMCQEIECDAGCPMEEVRAP